MSPKTIRPGLTAATRVGRELLAAGWRHDSTTPKAGGAIERLLLHPSGREITVTTYPTGSSDLTMTGLTLEQAADAITAAGLTGPTEPTKCYCATNSEQCPNCNGHERAPSDYWLTLAEDLRAAADKIATLAGTEYKPPYVNFIIKVSDVGNKDLAAVGHVDTIAAAFGATGKTGKTGGFYEHAAQATQGFLRVHVYGYVPAPEDSELERLRAENAKLRAQVGGAA